MSKTQTNYTIPLSVPSLRGKELKYLKECIDSEWISAVGNFVDRFESEIARYAGVKFAVSCINGTSALHISLILAGVGFGDAVIVPTVTFIAPVNAVKYVGANPIFMDCDDFLNIDVNKVKEFCEKECRFKNGKLVAKSNNLHVKAIIPVHIFGNPVDLEPLVNIVRRYNLAIIEDAAESIGAGYIRGRLKGKKTGAVGDIGCYSFNGNKIISSGAGGMILTNNSSYAEKSKYLTTQAKDDKLRYIHNNIGYNYRMDNLNAAVGLAQLEQLNKFVEIKRRNYLLYEKSVKQIKGLDLIKEPQYGFSTFWLYSLLIDKKIYGIGKEELLGKLVKNNIQARPLWRLNHLQQPYKDCLNYKIEKARYFYDRILNLPSSIGLKREEIAKITDILKNG